MRLIFATLLLAASPAAAWEATIGPVCTLSHSTDEADILLTYDPGGPEYSITLTWQNGRWDAAPFFAMRFDGGKPNTITTDRHALSEGDAALTVTDKGFGNVLDGLQFNQIATAYTDGQSIEIPLDGAAEPVARFRACADATTA